MTSDIELSKLLDTDHLATYTLGDHALETEVLNMFIDQSALYVARLRSPDDAKDWFAAAHSLKGSARGIGAIKVGLRAAQLEQVNEPLTQSVRAAFLVLLEGDLEQTKGAILRHLGLSAPAAFI